MLAGVGGQAFHHHPRRPVPEPVPRQVLAGRHSHIPNGRLRLTSATASTVPVDNLCATNCIHVDMSCFQMMKWWKSHAILWITGVMRGPSPMSTHASRIGYPCMVRMAE